MYRNIPISFSALCHFVGPLFVTCCSNCGQQRKGLNMCIALRKVNMFELGLGLLVLFYFLEILDAQLLKPRWSIAIMQKM